MQNPDLKGSTRGIMQLILGGAEIAGKMKQETQCDDVQYNETPHLI